MRLYDDQLIVVTGGCGFIGSCLIRHLNNQGIYNLVVVDEMGTDEKWKNLVGKRVMEVIEKDQLFDWLIGREQEIEAFIHLGACSSTVETNASYLLQNNYRYSVRLAEYALRHGQRFIYASSAATFGDGSQGFKDNHDGLYSLKPLNMYGFSKHLFDLWALEQGVIDRLTGLKFFNVFGPNEYHKGRMASAILGVLPQAQKEGVIRLFQSSEPDQFADGDQKRDFIYVKDAVRMIEGFLDNDATGIYNVGTGSAGTWNEIARAIFKALGKPANIQYVPMPVDLIGKYQNFTQADMKKTRSVLKEKAVCRPLEDAVVEYVKDYLVPGKLW